MAAKGKARVKNVRAESPAETLPAASAPVANAPAVAHPADNAPAATASALTAPAVTAPEATPPAVPAVIAPAAVRQVAAEPREPDGLSPLYANFVRVIDRPEELILDFGLNPQPFGPQNHPVKVSQRLVVNYFTAKRLWGALAMSLQRHEQAFGVVETDVNKRVIPADGR